MSASWEIRQGDCLERLAEVPDSSIDAVVCDPPYGIGFMGHEWDQPGDFGAVRSNGRAGGANGGQWDRARRTGPADRGSVVAGSYDLSLTANRRFQGWCEAWAREALRVLKPGGHLLVCGGTRTYHRMASGIEDAGFEIRDCLIWLYGSGFPKSLDVSKAIDKAAGAERAVVGKQEIRGVLARSDNEFRAITRPATPEAEQWDGWGTALKPAHEPIVVARKPLSGTVAANVLEHGTGAINVDGCRIANTEADRAASEKSMSGDRMWRRSGATGAATFDAGCAAEPAMDPSGRWPANVVLDEEAAAMLDEQTGELTGGNTPARRSPRRIYGKGDGSTTAAGTHGTLIKHDSGGASRFFYCAKASRAERNAGLDGAGHVHVDGRAWDVPGSHSTARANHHPTVKPISLMRWLVRLVTPPGGTVLDPFTGSGTTGCAAVLEGFDFVGVEREAEYVAIAQARLAYWADPASAEAALAAERAESAREQLHQETGALSLFEDELAV